MPGIFLTAQQRLACQGFSSMELLIMKCTIREIYPLNLLDPLAEFQGSA
jgi:hypothetical protein